MPTMFRVSLLAAAAAVPAMALPQVNRADHCPQFCLQKCSGLASASTVTSTMYVTVSDCGSVPSESTTPAVGPSTEAVHSSVPATVTPGSSSTVETAAPTYSTSVGYLTGGYSTLPGPSSSSSSEVVKTTVSSASPSFTTTHESPIPLTTAAHSSSAIESSHSSVSIDTTCTEELQTRTSHGPHTSFTHTRPAHSSAVESSSAIESTPSPILTTLEGSTVSSYEPTGVTAQASSSTGGWFSYSTLTVPESVGVTTSSMAPKPTTAKSSSVLTWGASSSASVPASASSSASDCGPYGCEEKTTVAYSTHTVDILTPFTTKEVHSTETTEIPASSESAMTVSSALPTGLTSSAEYHHVTSRSSSSSSSSSAVSTKAIESSIPISSATKPHSTFVWSEPVYEPSFWTSLVESTVSSAEATNPVESSTSSKPSHHAQTTGPATSTWASEINFAVSSTKPVEHSSTPVSSAAASSSEYCKNPYGCDSETFSTMIVFSTFSSSVPIVPSTVTSQMAISETSSYPTTAPTTSSHAKETTSSHHSKHSETLFTTAPGPKTTTSSAHHTKHHSEHSETVYSTSSAPETTVSSAKPVTEPVYTPTTALCDNPYGCGPVKSESSSAPVETPVASTVSSASLETASVEVSSTWAVPSTAPVVTPSSSVVYFTSSTAKQSIEVVTSSAKPEPTTSVCTNPYGCYEPLPSVSSSASSSVSSSVSASDPITFVTMTSSSHVTVTIPTSTAVATTVSSVQAVETTSSVYATATTVTAAAETSSSWSFPDYGHGWSSSSSSASAEVASTVSSADPAGFTKTSSVAEPTATASELPEIPGAYTYGFRGQTWRRRAAAAN